MDDMKISLSVPATIYSFGETYGLTQNKYVTPAKLKIFYVGKTGDNRVFTKQFSDQLLQTLPGTPVVAYYNEESDDFIGHNHTQYVFGYVPETATIGYISDGGLQFAITDVVLFTGRNDNIGAVASKIIGHAHSLELDPATVEYTIVRASNKIESITFNKGHFIGLSVLGNNEQPAFSGSAFFSADDAELKTFVDSFKEFKQEVELYKSGGQEMNDETNLPILENETPVVTETVADAKEICVEVKVEICDDVEGENIAPDEIPVEVPQMPMEPMMAEMPKDPEKDPEDMPMEPADPSQDPQEDSQDPKEEEEDLVKKDEETQCEVIPALVVEAQTQEGLEDVRDTKQEEEAIAKANADSAALNQAERQELNEYRKKAKFELIDTYDVSSEIKEKYRAIHEQFTVDALDKELAFELVKSQRQNKKSEVKVFSVMTKTAETESLQDIINRYKDK